MKLLILGGPKFLGRYLTQTALKRHHQVTFFNRGQTHPELFPEVEKLRGDRHGELQPLTGRKWDAVIDTCGFASGPVRAAATRLAQSVGHYTFISSVSVYADFSQPGLKETAPVQHLPAGAIEDEKDSETYGARKALCEQAAEAAMPGRVCNVRPGLIVGPHEANGRFTYWVRRAALGGEMLAPGPPDAPVQLLDVRDLAQWIVTLVESGKVGTYNTTGPAGGLTLRQMLEQCLAAAGSEARLTWVDEPFLLKHNVVPFSDLPFWLPLKPDAGFFAIDSNRALASGLAFRPLVETAKDTLRWARAAGSLPPSGLAAEREHDLLRAWEQANNG